MVSPPRMAWRAPSSARNSTCLTSIAFNSFEVDQKRDSATGAFCEETPPIVNTRSQPVLHTLDRSTWLALQASALHRKANTAPFGPCFQHPDEEEVLYYPAEKIEWYDNRQKRSEETQKDGRKDGLHLRWHENGEKQSEVIWKYAKRVSAKYWNSKGGEVETREEDSKK